MTEEALKGWQKKYRPNISKEAFNKTIERWNECDVFGAFNNDNIIEGYAVVRDFGSYAEFSVLRAKPEAEKNLVNAAIVAGIMDYYRDRLEGNFYINDGTRSISHETAFQVYLENILDLEKRIASYMLNINGIWFCHKRIISILKTHKGKRGVRA